MENCLQHAFSFHVCSKYLINQKSLFYFFGEVFLKRKLFVRHTAIKGDYLRVQRHQNLSYKKKP
jgi:hypothetical protein